jgi:hypothetical protein
MTRARRRAPRFASRGEAARAVAAATHELHARRAGLEPADPARDRQLAERVRAALRFLESAP